MKRFFITLITVVTFITAASSSVLAQYGQYTPAPTQSILIDKQVSRPVGQTKGGVIQYEYVDNLTPSDTRFQPGNDIYFKIRVKNTSSITLNNVMIQDRVPQYLNPIEGPGNYDSTGRTVSFNAGNFNPDEEQTYTFKMQWAAQNQLPADRGLMCVSNYARAYTDTVSDDDTAQACVEKQVINVKAAPKAGPEMNILLIAGELGLLGTGIALNKKKSSNLSK